MADTAHRLLFVLSSLYQGNIIYFGIEILYSINKMLGRVLILLQQENRLSFHLAGLGCEMPSQFDSDVKCLPVHMDSEP